MEFGFAHAGLLIVGGVVGLAMWHDRARRQQADARVGTSATQEWHRRRAIADRAIDPHDG